MNEETRKLWEERIAIMQAWLDGAEIEWRDCYRRDWNSFPKTMAPVWNWEDVDYRIKPQPKKLYINYYPDLADKWGRPPLEFGFTQHEADQLHLYHTPRQETMHRITITLPE